MNTRLAKGYTFHAGHVLININAKLDERNREFLAFHCPQLIIGNGKAGKKHNLTYIGGCVTQVEIQLVYTYIQLAIRRSRLQHAHTQVEAWQDMLISEEHRLSLLKEGTLMSEL